MSSLMPVTGSTGSWPRGDGRRTTRSSSRPGMRRWPPSRPSGTRSSPARSACAWRRRARGPSICSTACTTPSWTTYRWSRSSGRPTEVAMGGSYQQEVDLLTLFKDVASDYVQMVTVPEQLPNVLDRAIRIAMAERAPTAIIIPADVQELEYSPPTHAFKMVPSSLGIDWPRAAPRRRGDRARRRGPQRRRRRWRSWSGRAPAAPRRELERGRRPARRRRGQGAARQGRALRRAAVRDRLDRAARHPAELRDDDGLRHPADGRLELPLHPVPARVRPGPGGADRHRPGDASACATPTRSTSSATPPPPCGP